MNDASSAPSKDSRVRDAIAHWAPRFVANGISLTDFQEVTAGIAKWEDWCRAWSARGAVHEEMGRAALATKHFLTAAEHLSRAAVCYHFGKFVFVQDLEQMKAAHMKAVECRRLALPYLKPPGERVEIPYEGKKLYGNLRKPAGVTRPPIIAMAPGLDSAKEEMEAYEMPFLARGMATLCFDGPGQGEGEYDFAIRGDYEVAAKAVADFIETRSDVDASRMGFWGVSLGGYYAPRAAAFEKRIKACISLAGPYDWLECWDDLPEITRNAFTVRSKSKNDAEARKAAATLSLTGVAKNITCPLYVMTGKLDRLIPWEHAERLAKDVSGPVVLQVIEDGNHVAANRTYKWRPQTADWMAEQLGVPRT